MTSWGLWLTALSRCFARCWRSLSLGGTNHQRRTVRASWRCPLMPKALGNVWTKGGLGQWYLNKSGKLFSSFFQMAPLTWHQQKEEKVQDGSKKKTYVNINYHFLSKSRLLFEQAITVTQRCIYIGFIKSFFGRLCYCSVLQKMYLTSHISVNASLRPYPPGN